MIGSMLEFMKTGHLVSFLAIKLPFIDEDLVWGFHLNLMIQTTITTFGTIGGLSIETTSCVINNTIMLCADIINLDCSELTNQLENGGVSKVKMLTKLRNIFMKYEDLDQYLVDMTDLNYWRMFSAPILIVYSVSISTFCQYALRFPCGYGFAILTYSQLLIMCYMGNNIFDSQYRVVNSLSSLPWYLLPADRQKDIAYMLNRAQNGAVLTIGPLDSTLNYETATNVNENL
ncbi:uncharacterized protein LOC129576629 [Sitodiplosis mosellana]|uniref:uncharacterized protein LOC129576629 n=1 Tax=Sitodiplosis mosellana TaxID=263140 RepID=UPI00244432DA|nr:uncharacterized protein LOC129576629 [Sitodiplosis mosellana]